MLFLAVFCGFLAEYQLEHKIEKDKERQYMKSMLEDLVSDTSMLQTSINRAAAMENYRETMSKVFDIKVFNEMVKTFSDIIMPEGNPSIFNEDKQLINELLVKVHIARRNRLGSIRYLNRLKEKANNLIAMIKEEYHLE